MSSTTRSNSPLRAWSSPSRPLSATVARCPSARTPLATNAAIRGLVLNDQDAGHRGPPRVGCGAERHGDDESWRRRRRGSRAATVPPWARAIAARSTARARSPRRRRGRGRGRSARRSGRGRPSGHAGSGVAHPDPHARRGVRRPDRDHVPGPGVLDGVVGELQDRLGQALLVGDQPAGADPSSCQSRSPRARALASRASVSWRGPPAAGRRSRGGCSWRAGSGRRRGVTSGRPRRAAGPGSPRSPRGCCCRGARGDRAAPSAGSAARARRRRGTGAGRRSLPPAGRASR